MPGALGEAERLLNPVGQEGTVRQTGQRIVAGHKADVFLGELALDGDAGDVAGGLADAYFRLPGCTHRV